MHCDDCGQSFFYPGQSGPQIVEGGCPECGGHLRPEPDQPSPVHGDGVLRDMPSAGGGDDMGGNPLQEGILGTTDGGWQNRQKRDESFASVRTAEQWSQPRTNLYCPHCAAEIPPGGVKRGQGGHVWYQCSGGCGMASNEETIHHNDPSLAQHPDPWMDNEPGTMTFPQHWTNTMRQTSNQEVQMPWTHFEVDEVAPPGISNEKAEEIMEEKTAFAPLIALGMGALRAAAPTLMRAALGQGVGNILGGGAPAAAVAAPDEMRPLEAVASLDEDDDQGSDLSNTRHNETEDPEDVDPKEKDDGDNKDFQKDFSVDEGGGGTDSPTGPDPQGPGDMSGQYDEGADHQGDDPDAPTPGLEAMHMLLPLVLHYAESGEAGQDHPLMKTLLELLTSEGIMDGPDDHAAAAEIIKNHREPKTSAIPMPGGGMMPGGGALPGGMQPAGTSPAMSQPTPVGAPQPAVGPNPFSQGNCQSCGATQTPGQPCPQCGAAGLGAQVMAGANQGPHSPDQVAAVQQMLIDQGRVDEVPNVVMQPEMYAREMAEVAQKVDTPPQDITQPQPAQEEAPPEATMPMPGMSIPQQGQPTARVAVAMCPGCQGPLQPDGSCAGCERSPAAGQAVPTPGFPAAGAPMGNQNAITPTDPSVQQFRAQRVGHPGEGGMAAADQMQQRDISQEQDSSHQWQTQDGTPVVKGQQYELHTPGMGVPDIVTVNRTLPEAIDLQFTGEFQLGFNKQIARQEWDMMGYTLADPRAQQAAAPDPQSQEQGAPAPAPGGAATDGGGMGMSDMAPPQGVRASVPTHDPDTGAPLTTETRSVIARLLANAAADTGPGDQAIQMVATAGAHFSPSAQRELIDEEGVARNADRLDLSNTHYEARAPTRNVVNADSFLW